MRRLCFFAFMLVFLLIPCGKTETILTAVNVGKGDAILLINDDHTILFDLGKPAAAGRISRTLREYGITSLDAVIITHTDQDHIGGLDWLMQSDLSVGMWVTSPYCVKYKEEKHPLTRAGIEPIRPYAGDRLMIGDLSLTILAPLREAEEENDDSLVIMVEGPDGTILMTGDMESAEETDLLLHTRDLNCDILKVPNHGDDDAAVCGLVEAAAAKAALISTDPWEKPGTPDPDLLDALEDIGTDVYLTEGLDAMELRLVSGSVASHILMWEVTGIPDGITAELDEKEGLVTVRNETGSTLDLTDWYLVSERKELLFLLPEEILTPGGSVTIGTAKSDPGSYDLLWEEKNVFSKKKPDSVTLFTPDGRPAACAENGL